MPSDDITMEMDEAPPCFVEEQWSETGAMPSTFMLVPGSVIFTT